MSNSFGTTKGSVTTFGGVLSRITHHASRSTPVLTRGRLWPPYCGSIVKLTSHWLPRAVPGWLDGPMPERSGTEMGVIVAVSRGGRRVRDRVRECVRVWFGRS